MTKPPAIATPTARRLVASFTSSARKKAGKIASIPKRSGSDRADPPMAPMAVPPIQPAAWGIVDPRRSPRSKRPSPRLAIAHDASTTAWPSAARLRRPPLSTGATPKPMGRNRVFMSSPAVMAAAGPPPALSTLSAANWAEPANTITDITIACTAEKPAWRASTPKETDSTKPAAA